MYSNRMFVALGKGEKKISWALVRIAWARVVQMEVLLLEGLGEDGMLARTAAPRSIVPAL